MASFDVVFDQDYLSGLLETDIAEVMEEALNTAAPILVESIRQGVEESGHVESGDLSKSVTANKAKRSKNGAWIVNAYPKGYSATNTFYKSGKGGQAKKYKVSNAAKLIWIEYGVNGHQPPRPLIARATSRVKEKILKSLQDTYSRKVGNA